ncbi:MAG: formate dehydrogenase accessory sulfurtransferase FdhD [Dehalococcoidales bacterium]|nr:formate dehydrogenase accessory sulfurtransferase FdhD [Dehalococcoidales bacterium]
MKDVTAPVNISRIAGQSQERVPDAVARETPLTIILNNRELVTLLCSPEKPDYLAAGFLASEGFVSVKSEIKKIAVDSQRGIVRVETTGSDNVAAETMHHRFITSGCGRGASFYSAADAATMSKIESTLQISSAAVFVLMKDFQHRSEVYRATGGVHSAALCDANGIAIFAEDIGRHNAIDKIFGQCLLEDIPAADKLIITSGRISSEILLKVARRNIPVIISKSAPTDLGVRLAQDMGITLIGFARGNRMNIYAHESRITVE